MASKANVLCGLLCCAVCGLLARSMWMWMMRFDSRMHRRMRFQHYSHAEDGRRVGTTKASTHRASYRTNRYNPLISLRRDVRYCVVSATAW